MYGRVGTIRGAEKHSRSTALVRKRQCSTCFRRCGWKLSASKHIRSVYTFTRREMTYLPRERWDALKVSDSGDVEARRRLGDASSTSTSFTTNRTFTSILSSREIEPESRPFAPLLGLQTPGCGCDRPPPAAIMAANPVIDITSSPNGTQSKAPPSTRKFRTLQWPDVVRSRD